MNTLARFLLIVCVMSVRTEETLEDNELNNAQLVTFEPDTEAVVNNEAVPLESGSEARSIRNGYDLNRPDQHQRTKPLKNIFLGIYKNYKSTYLGNRTTEEYKQNLKEHSDLMKKSVAKDADETSEEEVQLPEEDSTQTQTESVEDVGNVSTQTSILEAISPTAGDTLQWMLEQFSSTSGNLLSKKRRKRKRKEQQETQAKKRMKVAAPAGGDDPLLNVEDNQYSYNVGPGVNMSLDMANDVVKVNLNGNNLRDIITGHWLADNTEEGRGKKYDMMTKVLPLFILPFLIQSAIVPFLVTKLKLLLMKSILVGKLAIFLLIISAIKNSNKMVQSYEVAPSYWAGEPSRRSELAAAATNSAYNGYRVEGKPTTWIN